MYIFIRLLAAHFIADFLLQTDKVYRIKIRYKWGVLLHGSIVALVTALFLLPYLTSPLVFVLFAISMSLHIIQDKAKIIYNLQLEKNNLWTFLFDQFLHFVVLGFIALGTLNMGELQYPGPAFLDRFYGDTRLMLFIIWLLVITYTSGIMQEYIKKGVGGDKSEGFNWPRALPKYLEMLYRGSIAACLYLGGVWHYGVLGLALLGFFLVYKGKMPSLNYRIGTILAVIVGFLMKITIN